MEWGLTYAKNYINTFLTISIINSLNIGLKVAWHVYVYLRFSNTVSSSIDQNECISVHNKQVLIKQMWGVLWISEDCFNKRSSDVFFSSCTKK